MKFYILWLIVICSLFIKCAKTDKLDSYIMDRAAEYIEEHPDSSLLILNQLKLDKLSNIKDRARYALLKSMALDKNLIDVTEDSLTSIALEYYTKHGSPDDILKAYYYNGKVNSYSGFYDGAIENYIKAEQYVQKSKDYIAIGRLYNAKMRIYMSIYDVKSAVEPGKLSAYYYLIAKDTSRYITALNSLSSVHLAANQFEELEGTFAQIKQLEQMMTLSHKCAYYVNMINYKIAIKDSLQIKEAVSNYIGSFIGKENLINWLVLIRAYSELKDYDRAIDAIIKYKQYNNKYEDIFYYFASDVYQSLSNYQQALEYLKLYQNHSSKEDIKIFQSNAKFIEEKYILEKKQLTQQNYILVLILSIFLIVFALILFSIFILNLVRKRDKKLCEVEEQRQILRNEYEKALVEQKRLKTLISKNKLNKEVVKVLEERMLILNNFIVSDISGLNMSNAIQELKLYLNNNERFLKSTRLSFELTHPKFVSYLLENKLSDLEISCCCLYCIGLNGSEISNFLNIKYYYKQSSTIRKKLKIHSVNIDNFLII